MKMHYYFLLLSGCVVASLPTEGQTLRRIKRSTDAPIRKLNSSQLSQDFVQLINPKNISAENSKPALVQIESKEMDAQVCNNVTQKIKQDRVDKMHIKPRFESMRISGHHIPASKSEMMNETQLESIENTGDLTQKRKSVRTLDNGINKEIQPALAFLLRGNRLYADKDRYNGFGSGDPKMLMDNGNSYFYRKPNSQNNECLIATNGDKLARVSKNNNNHGNNDGHDDKRFTVERKPNENNDNLNDNDSNNNNKFHFDNIDYNENKPNSAQNRNNENTNCSNQTYKSNKVVANQKPQQLATAIIQATVLTETSPNVDTKNQQLHPRQQLENQQQQLNNQTAQVVHKSTPVESFKKLANLLLYKMGFDGLHSNPSGPSFSNPIAESDDNETVDYLYNTVEPTRSMGGTGVASDGSPTSNTVSYTGPLILSPQYSAANEQSQPFNFLESVLDLLMANEDDKEDEIERRCPMHGENQKNSGSKSTFSAPNDDGDGKNDLIQVCSCRIFKNKKNTWESGETFHGRTTI